MRSIGEKLVIATHNAGKLREIRQLLAPFGIECLGAGELGLDEPDETGTTFAENSALKAIAAAKATGTPALSDDSGLSVTALGGRPGVYTADWAERQWFEGPEGRDWYLAMGKVEGLLAAQGAGIDRSATFHCVLTLAWPDGQTHSFAGTVDGALTWPPRGNRGFGYDPVFVAAGMSETFGEIDPAHKAQINHRADAFAKLVAWLNA